MIDKYCASLRLKVLEKIIEDIRKDGLRVGITRDNKLFVQNTVVEPTTEYGYAQSKSSFELYNDILFDIGQIVYHPTYYTSCTDLSLPSTAKNNTQIKSYRVTNIYKNEYSACSPDDRDKIVFKSDDIGKTIFLSSEEANNFVKQYKTYPYNYVPGL